MIPEQAWRAAVDGDGEPRDGAQVAELTAWMPIPMKPTRPPARFGPQEWPAGMRIIARRERPHPGAQLRLTDHNRWRITCFVTNTPRSAGWRLADLEVRHRQRARCEDRIRGLKDTGLRNLPFHGYGRTASGWRSSRWPPTCWLGCRHWPGPSMSLPGDGSPNACGSGYSPWPDASFTAAVEDDCDSHATGHGTNSSTPAGPHSPPLDPITSTTRSGPGEPATPAPAIRHASAAPTPHHHMTELSGGPDETSRLGDAVLAGVGVDLLTFPVAKRNIRYSEPLEPPGRTTISAGSTSRSTGADRPLCRTGSGS